MAENDPIRTLQEMDRDLTVHARCIYEGTSMQLSDRQNHAALANEVAEMRGIEVRLRRDLDQAANEIADYVASAVGT